MKPAKNPLANLSEFKVGRLTYSKNADFGRYQVRIDVQQGAGIFRGPVSGRLYFAGMLLTRFDGDELPRQVVLGLQQAGFVVDLSRLAR